MTNSTALDEFACLLKPSSVVIRTAPFASNIHMAPYHYCSGFSKYWYEHHLAQHGFRIKKSLIPNGDWYVLLLQEITRLGGLERQRGNWSWPFVYLRGNKRAEDLVCFGWQCVAAKDNGVTRWQQGMQQDSEL